MPHLAWLFKAGAVGLVSPNCDGPRTESSVLLTASAGASCEGRPFVQEFYDANETLPATGENAGAAYLLRTGRRAPRGSAVFLGLAEALRLAAESGRQAQVGSVGDAAHRAGMKTGVIGNADLDRAAPNRAASVIAVDSRGLIDIGHLTSPLGATDACGFPTSAQELANLAARCLKDADLVVVNFGDSTRLDEMKISLSDEAYAGQRTRMLLRLDGLVGRLTPVRGDNREPGKVLVLVSFSPPQTGHWDRLTPIVVFTGHKRGGLLTSWTTRTPGLIAASDFPSLIKHLPALSARGMLVPGSLEAVRAMDIRVTSNHTLILPVLWIFAGAGALSLTVSAVLIAVGRPITRRVHSVLSFGLLITASAC
ncbi:MAG: hypothetical protein ACP5R5_14795, partial [Armatimonadota bacterium]